MSKLQSGGRAERYGWEDTDLGHKATGPWGKSVTRTKHSINYYTTEQTKKSKSNNSVDEH